MPLATPTLPAALSDNPSKSTSPFISSTNIAGSASKRLLFMSVMISKIFIFISSSMAASWHVGGRHSCKILFSIFRASGNSQKPWQPTALWSVMRCPPFSRRWRSEATRLPKQTKSSSFFLGACSFPVLLSGDMKLTKGKANFQSSNFSDHHFAAAQSANKSSVGASYALTVIWPLDFWPHLLIAAFTLSRSKAPVKLSTTSCFFLSLAFSRCSRRFSTAPVSSVSNHFTRDSISAAKAS
mmetsp:Transcript_130908/g.330510  ORF Transcript_130908/g.330510 Transcript_130908/m.330510 type:complete len:240 (+) Transcript_130908:1483-2202(+)